MNRRYLLFIPDCFLLSMEDLFKYMFGGVCRVYQAIIFCVICY